MKNKKDQCFWHYTIGKEFQDAFCILIGKFNATNKTWTLQIDRPSYYCAGQVIEHYIKSFLEINNIQYPKNSKSHNLIELINLEQDKIINFFGLENDDIAQIQKLNERYYKHEFYGKDDLRYGMTTGLRESPHPDNLNRVINKMENFLKDELLKISREGSNWYTELIETNLTG